MAMVIDGGAAAFDALVYGDPSHRMVNYFNQQMDNLHQAVTGVTTTFIDKAQQAFDMFNSEAAVRAAQAVARKARNLWTGDHIRYLSDIGQLQHASPTMQRWIMAEPTLRRLHKKQRCDGYSDSYVDMDPGMIGSRHYDYRCAVNGLMMEEDDRLVANCYFEDLRDDNDNLHLGEQIDIMNTWDAVKAAILRGKDDPTSPSNDSL